MLVAIWNMLMKSASYGDLGDEFYARRNPDRVKQRALAQLRKLGYKVTITEEPSAA